MAELPVVCHECDDIVDLFCLYCGTKLLSVPGPEEEDRWVTFPDPCEHLLFVVLPEVGFSYVSAQLTARLIEKGFTVDAAEMETAVIPTVPNDIDQDEAEFWSDGLYPSKVMEMVIDAMGPVDRGFILQECEHP